jgi:hypothetical protein
MENAKLKISKTISYTILDFRFWILDWAIPSQAIVLEIEIMQL